MKLREWLATWIAGRDFEAPITVVAPQPPLLAPGLCECHHDRCRHVNGIGKCGVTFWKDANGKPIPEEERGTCNCKIYIKDDDDDDDDDDDGDETPPIDPEVAELERMLK